MGKHQLRRGEFPLGSGLRIREIINRSGGADFGLSYRVTIPERLASPGYCAASARSNRPKGGRRTRTAESTMMSSGQLACPQSLVEAGSAE